MFEAWNNFLLVAKADFLLNFGYDHLPETVLLLESPY